MRGRAKSPGALVCAAALIYAVLLSLLSIARYRAYITTGDNGIFTQYVWLLGHARSPFNTVIGRFFFGDHVEPGVALLAPFGAIGHVGESLVVLQSLALAGVAPLLYLTSRRLGVSPRLAAIVPLLWLVSPVVIHPNLDDFHPESLAAVTIAASALAGASKRWLAFFLLAALACSFREDVSLLYVGAGLVLARRGNGRRGVALSTAALLWFALCVLVILPVFGPAVHSDFIKRFSNGRGSSFFGFVHYIVVAHPLTTISQMFGAKGLGVLALMALSTAGLCLFAPRWLVAPAPLLLLNLLSAAGQPSISSHFTIVPMTGVAVAGAVGARTVHLSEAARRTMLRVAVGSAVLLVFLSAGVVDTLRKEIAQSASLRADRTAALAAVPAGAPVSVSIDLSGHVAERKDAYVFWQPFRVLFGGSVWNATDRRVRTQSLRYVVLDGTVEIPSKDQRANVALVTAAGFHRILRRGPVTVYARP